MSKRVGYILSIIISIAISVSYFFNWFGIDGGLIGESGCSVVYLCSTVLQTANIAGMLGGEEIVTALTVCAIAVLALCALSVIFFVIYIITGIVNKGKHKKWGNIGMIFAMLVAIIMIALPLVVNHVIKLPVAKATFIPYSVLSAAILAIVFLNTLDVGKKTIKYAGYPYGTNEYGGMGYENNSYENHGYEDSGYENSGYEDNSYEHSAYNNYDNGYNDNSDNASIARDGTKVCPMCGGVNPDFAAFCKGCGFNFNDSSAYSNAAEEPVGFNDVPPVATPAEEPYTEPVAAAEEEIHTPSEPAAKKGEWNKASDMLDLSGGSSKDEGSDKGGSSLKINM